MMYQSLHRDRIAKARCRICSSNTEEFDTKYKTVNQGLGVDVRDGDAQHFGAALFQRGEYVMHELGDLAERYAADTWFTRTTAKIHPRPECIRQRVQKIMNTMCGRRNIDQIMCAG